MKQPPCPFCARRDAGAYEEAGLRMMRFEPLNPIGPGHMLFMPMRHLVDAADEPFVTGKVFEAAARWGALREEVNFNLITSAGPHATQTVRHLHVHYVPRHEGDGMMLPWTGQKQEQRVHIHMDPAPPQIRYVPVFPPMGMWR